MNILTECNLKFFIYLVNKVACCAALQSKTSLSISILFLNGLFESPLLICQNISLLVVSFDSPEFMDDCVSISALSLFLVLTNYYYVFLLVDPHSTHTQFYEHRQHRLLWWSHFDFSLIMNVSHVVSDVDHFLSLFVFLCCQPKRWACMVIYWWFSMASFTLLS